jgi:hypothetical protein
LSHIRATCSASLHTLSQSTPIGVLIRINCWPVALHPLVSLRCSHSRTNRDSTVVTQHSWTQKIGDRRIAPCRHRFSLSTVFALCL